MSMRMLQPFELLLYAAAQSFIRYRCFGYRALQRLFTIIVIEHMRGPGTLPAYTYAKSTNNSTSERIVKGRNSS